MRLCYVLPRPELGGGNKVIFQHAHLLPRRGWEVSVAGEGPPPDWLRLEVPYWDHRSGPPPLPPQDLVVATYWTTLALAERLALGPVAHFCQGYEGGLEHLRPRWGEIAAAYSRPLPALAVSPHLAALLAERFGRASAPAPPAADASFRPRPRLVPRRVPWIAVPGIFEAAVKDVPTALAAVAQLRRRGLSCRVLRFAMLPLSEAERALLAPDRYLCAEPPARIAAELARCDLLLLPSRPEEGFGLPLLEAMMAKVPAVAARIPSTEHIGGAARLVPPGDAGAFAAAAWELLRDARAWRRARRLGRLEARRFAPEIVGPLLERSLAWARRKALDPRTPPLPQDELWAPRPAAAENAGLPPVEARENR
jgi:glycosyltransferase involved in cell wall biosynthesis